MKNGVLLDCACLGVFLMVRVFMGVKSKRLFD
jgi:hypothetical protein